MNAQGFGHTRMIPETLNKSIVTVRRLLAPVLLLRRSHWIGPAVAFLPIHSAIRGNADGSYVYWPLVVSAGFCPPANGRELLGYPARNTASLAPLSRVNGTIVYERGTN